ncbi:type III-B CRISPR module-associated protein Cmr5 [Deferribacterales bacterium Es71-Z0220]|uniref:type III-B CRISPR module-associated protein Cmr5 n=1 Tax=Deferrivibrio essentukiensis TaxID=2880922 RepID=UPI001F603280|nr:type III-B CRISPR module-associated protein Cmr5 [Deferrivibrio essentukiensis]MCB4205242.1 type III-B CRISPR module-associated protein Cmr5 [Deferrivibrio essentukiensis]
MRTLGQKRAEYALDKILKLECDRKEFKSFSAGVPTMILQNGFGQTMAFFIAKGTDKDLKINQKDKHIILLNIIREWVKDIIPSIDEKTFINNLNIATQEQYLEAQKEALKLLEWIKRYANAGF